MLIEVCCGSVDDAVLSEKLGADRIEFTTSMCLGGLTPSYGMFKRLKACTKIPAMVMVRPRESGYVYSEHDIEVMVEDAKFFAQNGAEGVVFGILNKDGTIDVDACKRVLSVIGDCEAIFHRAFDLVPDPFEAMETLISLGFKRILTKGQKNTLEEGIHLMKELQERANGRIEFISGGVRKHNLGWLKDEVKPDQVHVGAFTFKTDESVANNPHVSFGSKGESGESLYQIVDPTLLEEIIKGLRNS